MIYVAYINETQNQQIMTRVIVYGGIMSCEYINRRLYTDRRTKLNFYLE